MLKSSWDADAHNTPHTRNKIIVMGRPSDRTTSAIQLFLVAKYLCGPIYHQIEFLSFFSRFYVPAFFC